MLSVSKMKMTVLLKNDNKKKNYDNFRVLVNNKKEVVLLVGNGDYGFILLLMMRVLTPFVVCVFLYLSYYIYMGFHHFLTMYNIYFVCYFCLLKVYNLIKKTYYTYTCETY